MKPKLKPPGTKRLKLKSGILLSTCAFKFNLRVLHSGSRPLLVDMADPEVAGAAGAAGDAGLPFMRALGCFKRRCAYANAVNDFLVSYETAALDPVRPPRCCPPRRRHAF